MRRVLFVDDEPEILAGLQSLLRRYRNKWHAEFVAGGESAIEALSRGPFDVIVTDMRMPKVDGAQLLKYVQQNHPQMVRIVLSGHSEVEAALRAVPVAHQFLSKPCDAKMLEETVDRACNLQALVSDDTVRAMVGQIKRLPSVPRVYQALMTVMSKPDASIGDVAAVLEQDMAMSARILQVINSAFFGLPQRVTRARDAVSYLGLNMVKSVVLMSELFAASNDQPVPKGVSLESLQRHAFLTAAVARKLIPEKRKADDAFMAGLLHDIGKLIIATQIPDHLRQVEERMEVPARPPMYVVEEGLVGVSHAEVGAYLLGIWGLPYAIVEAVADHHHPERVATPSFDVLTAVHVANALANEQEGRGADLLNMDYLKALGLDAKLDGWRRMAEEIALEAKKAPLPK
jgi:putative nucleotidyltransferase with HDIG domain